VEEFDMNPRAMTPFMLCSKNLDPVWKDWDEALLAAR
jgi:hypothetical protein